MKQFLSYLLLSLLTVFPVFLLHVVVTCLLGLVIFASGMGSFTHGVGPAYYLASAVMWVWNPVVMLLINGHLRVRDPQEALPILWSLFVAIIVGIMTGSFRKPSKKIQDASTSNPDLIGTPWEHDSGFTLDETLSAKTKRAEQGADGKPPEADQPPHEHTPTTRLP